MENLKLTRIDFRLIHGQVMTRWVAKYEIESIVVIDDRSAKSPILKKFYWVLHRAASRLSSGMSQRLRKNGKRTNFQKTIC